jgi:hypothetical protein
LFQPAASDAGAIPLAAQIILCAGTAVCNGQRVRWVGHAARVGGKRIVRRILLRKLEEEMRVVRPRCRWEKNIAMHFRDRVMD